MLLPSFSRIRLIVETLEDRLTPSWSSIPPVTITPPADYTSVSQNSQGDVSGNATIAGTEIDWYRFTALATGPATFQALTPSSNLDTVMALYNSSGSRVAYNDDISLGNRDSRFLATLTVGQTYYLGVTNYINTAGGSYTWSLDGSASNAGPGDDSFEENDTLASASDLGAVTTTRSITNLVMADGHDWYRFNLATTGTSGSSFAINFQNAQGDLDLELYNAAGNRIGNSDGTGNTETISLNGLSAGTYYAHVLGFRGVSNPSYSMVITPNGGANTGGFSIQLRMSGLTSSQQAIFQQAVARWQQIITGDLPNATYNGVAVDDLLIDASARTIDGAGGILGQAGPDRFRAGTSIPYHGSMQFDSADLASLESDGGLIFTVMHEIGHILGIGTIWSTRGLLAGAGTSNPRFTGARARAEYNAIFGVSATGVPVENSGGSGTRDSHWRESIFGNELMTGYLNSGFNPLSRITVASLADLGYQVDMSQADGYSPGGNGFLRGSGGNSGGASLRVAHSDVHLLFVDELPLTISSPVAVPITPATPIAVSSNPLRPQEAADQWSVLMPMTESTSQSTPAPTTLAQTLMLNLSLSM